MNNIEHQLRKEILEQLQKVTKSNAPKIYSKIQSETGYREMEQRIIIMVANERITPSAAIPQIESEM